MEEYEKLKQDPYNYICNWVESIYPHTGKRIFEILSLVPCSLILPDLPFKSKLVRSNINVLFLAPPANAKSSLSKQFAHFTYCPLEVESITPARLEHEVASSPLFSLIVGDFARMSRDPIIIKIVENILGEEKKVSRKTMQTDIDTETDGVGLICGTPSDLSDYLTGGLLFRMVPLIMFHTMEEHSNIGKHINEQIGIFNHNTDSREELIKNYYDELLTIQNGKHDKIKPVLAYRIPDSFRTQIYDEWNRMTSPIVHTTSLSFFRELQECYRFLVSHAFLNIFNREVKDNCLTPNEEDFKIALNLMRRTISIKYKIIQTERFARSIRNSQELTRIMQSSKISQEYKDILMNIVDIKSGRVKVKGGSI